MTEPAAEFTFGSWAAPAIPLGIEYPLEVMDEIRAAVSDGLQQLAHGGLEVAGVMFGARREGSIRILTWRPIVCEHAQGPTLRLSERDRAGLTSLLEAAKADEDLKGLQPVGWFLSHARSDIFLTASDLEIYNQYFPEPWQVTLVLRPARMGPARAGFFVREADGTLKADSSHRDFTVEPLHRASPAKELPIPTNDARSARRSEPAIDKPVVGKPMVEKPAAERTEAPRFLGPRPKRAHGRWLWVVPALLAALIAGVLFKDRIFPAPSRTFGFRAYNAGETVQLEWDHNSPVVRSAARAILDITEGGEVKHYPLTADQLQDGRMTYVRHSGDLEMRMTVFPSAGPTVQEYAHLLGPATASANTATPPAAEAPPEWKAERDRLESEVKRLQNEVRQEKARADKLQDTVRILQNRIDVDAARGQGPGAKQQ